MQKKLGRKAGTEFMDTTSTVNKTWSICAFTSFIGCLILLLSLNQGQGRLNFSSLQNTARPITSSDPTSSVELPEPDNLFQNKTLANEEEVKCNIFDGNWVYDPERNPAYTASQCPFLSVQVSCQRNGRPDNKYEKWSWEAKGCNIPRFNGTDMLERLRGKRLIIVGDSLNRNQWESLACLLYSSIPSSRAHIDVIRSDYKLFMAKDYNCSVEFYWSPFLVHRSTEQANGSMILRLDKLSRSAYKWQGADIMVFNTGHWWTHSGKWNLFQYDGKLVKEMAIEHAFEMAIRTWADWIDSNVDPTKTTVFFRSISPEHKRSVNCYNSTEPIMGESYSYRFPKPLREIVERTIGGDMKTPVRYLNITKLSEYRRDAHPSVYVRKQDKLLIAELQQQEEPKSKKDCSHWCLPGLPDTWNKLLYADMVLESSKGITTS